MKTFKKLGILERLQKGTVLCAEGYLFEFERRGYLKAGAYVPEVVLDFPDAVRELHREFLRAGSDVMVAFTYYAHRAKMKTIGREYDIEDLNRSAVRLAREVAQEGDALVAGNLCNTWEYDHRNHSESEKVVRPMFEEQAQWAVQEGVDFFIAETFKHTGEALIALDVLKKTGLPVLISFIAEGDKTADGYTWKDACRTLYERGADIVGLNCGRGPNTMIPLLASIKKVVRGHVAALPVPFRTTERQPYFQVLQEKGQARGFPLALDPHLHTRFEMADFARRAQTLGVNYVGVCCGGAPHYVRSMAEALGRTVPASKYSPDLSQHPMLGKL